MDLTVIDANFRKKVPIDVFDSLIWTDRYCAYGDFELVASPESGILSKILQGPYLVLKESKHAMILDYRAIKTDVESGNRIMIKGISLESILLNRIVWNPTALSGNFQNEIERLLNENVIAPTDSDREIPMFAFEASTDPAITSLTIDNKFYGEYVYDVIAGLCFANGIGFKISLQYDDQVTGYGDHFVFSLYAGADRSYNQVANPHVTFSPDFDNLINSDHIISARNLKNVALVAGEKGVGNVRKTVSVGTTTGINRREVFIDAQNIQRNIDGGSLTEAQYEAKLVQKGEEDLSTFVVVETFEGQIAPVNMYVYGQDFFLGDLVQTENEYGNAAVSRVTEIIHSQDTTGVKIYPTFTSFS